MALGRRFIQTINKYLFIIILAAPVVVVFLPSREVTTYSLRPDDVRMITTTSEAKIEAPERLLVTPSRLDAKDYATTTTSTTSTTVAPVPTKSGRSAEESCPQWFDLAVQVGWAEENLGDLGYVLWRESRCDPNAFNPDDPKTGSRGLTQINGYWCLPNQYHPEGWLQKQNIGLATCEDLYDPVINLKAALAIYNYSGWSPWAYM